MCLSLYISFKKNIQVKRFSNVSLFTFLSGSSHSFDNLYLDINIVRTLNFKEA